ncbi:MAG: hypothetical protein ABR518_10445 [Actinomycetota bacterium]
MRKLRSLILIVLVLLGTATARADDPRDEPPEVENPVIETITGGAAYPIVGSAIPAPRSAAASASSGRSSAPTFYPNAKMPCSTDLSGPAGCGQLLEPEVVSAPDGTIYVTAQEGVPGGVDLWRRNPTSFEYVQLHKPDQTPVLTETTGLAYGGGDNDITISTDGKVYMSSLALTSAVVATSRDRGQTFENNPVASNMPGVDRQWMTSLGTDTVYMTYHDIYVAQIWMVKSTDAGATFGPPQPMIPAALLPQFASLVVLGVGNIMSDIEADPDGRIAMAFLGTSDVVENFTPLEKPHNVYVWVTDEEGENPTTHTVFEGDPDANFQGLFPALASDRSGNLYAAWTDIHGVYLSVSRNHGVSWSKPQRISRGSGNRSTVFPFVIAGTKGRVGVSWLGTSAESNDDPEARWKTYYAVSTNALSSGPTWTQVVASDHVVHTGSICLEGLLCDVTGGDRTLAEVLQMGLTKDGRVLIAYPDDSSTSFGWSYIVEQRFGPGLLANVTPRPPKPPKPRPGGPVVTPVRRTGSETFYLTPGQAGTPVMDPEGNVVDAPGDIAGIGSKPGNEGHVASANVWTTAIAGFPLVFEGAPLSAPRILGGTLRLTAFLAEPTAAAVVGTITGRLLDVAPNGKETEIATGGSTYEAGPSTTRSTYPIVVQRPFEVLKGHRLRLELSFTCFCSTTVRLYYGTPEQASGFVMDRYARRD